MQDLSQQLDSTGLTNGTNLNLGIDSGMIATVLTVGTVVSIVLGLAIVVYMIINIAHRWKSEKAMMEMAKDIKVIKELLEKETVEKNQKPPVLLATADKPVDASSEQV